MRATMGNNTIKMKSYINRIVVSLCIVSSLIFCAKVTAQPAGNFIRIVNSPRAVGMGGGALLLTDQESVFYNPAAMALYHRTTRISVTTPFLGTAWFPNFVDDFRLRGASVSFSVHRDEVSGSSWTVGISFQKLNYGIISRRDPDGNPDGSESPRDMALGLSLGYAQTGRLSYGIGITSRGIVSELTNQGTALEIGTGNATAEILDAAAMMDYSLSGSETSARQISIRASILRSLKGTKLTYIDAQQADPSATVNQIGAAISGRWGDPNLRTFSALLSAQIDSDISGGENKVGSIERVGLELGLYEMIYARVGAFNTAADEKLPSSYGAGFSLKGLLRLTHRKELAKVVELGEYPFWRSIDLRFDVARIPNQNDLALSGTKFWKVSLAWVR